jgi:hypothetical protein
VIPPVAALEELLPCGTTEYDDSNAQTAVVPDGEGRPGRERQISTSSKRGEDSSGGKALEPRANVEQQHHAVANIYG